MGKLTRRVKFIAKERRLSIPAEFLHTHGIERGDQIVLSTMRDRLFAFPLALWERYGEVADQVDGWLPEAAPAFAAVVRGGTPLRLGSQDRVVLPRSFPFRLEESARLHWELVDGVLVMEPEHAAVPERPALGAPAGQGSLLELMSGGLSDAPAFDREAASEELIERISVARIDWRDRQFADGSAIPTEALLRSMKVEGVRRPLILRERAEGNYQVIDGFSRLTAARQLRMRTVPALVWRGVDDLDCARLKLMERTRQPAQEGSTLHRLQSTLRLHEDQVALKEIEHITGRRKRTLQRYLRVAQDPRVRTAIETGRLSIFKAEEILKAGVDPEVAMREAWTVKQIREAGRKSGPRRVRRIHGAQRDT